MVPATTIFTDLVSNYNLFDDSNIIQIAPSPTNQEKYTIKLSQPGLNLFSEAAKKTDGKVSVNKTNGTCLNSNGMLPENGAWPIIKLVFF